MKINKYNQQGAGHLLLLVLAMLVIGAGVSSFTYVKNHQVKEASLPVATSNKAVIDLLGDGSAQDNDTDSSNSAPIDDGTAGDLQ